jgi:hypothetical protein
MLVNGSRGGMLFAQRFPNSTSRGNAIHYCCLKYLASISLLIIGAVSVHGQACVNFNNRVLLPSYPGDPAVVAPVYGVNPVNPTGRLSGNAMTNGGATDYTGLPLLSGTTFTASLWAAPVTSGFGAEAVVAPDFQLLGSVPFRTLVTTRGFWSLADSTFIIPFVNQPNQPVLFQVRAWDNANGTITTWADALASANTAMGYSDTITVNSRFDPSLPKPPVDLAGLQSFNLTLVPEPAMAAFAVLGSLLGALVWRARK